MSRLRIAIIFISAFFLSWLSSRSIFISCGVSSAIGSILFISQMRAINQREWELTQILPELIDHLISGIQSGLSLNEVLVNLHQRGPQVTQPFFLEFHEELITGESFEEAIAGLQRNFGVRAADQLFESLIFAKSLGGSDLLSVLRQLGDFIRQDIALRREIQAKQGWIKNSAHLSAIAPWILLLLLAAQPSTSEAFSTPQGALILSIGVVMTAVAYLWMGKLSQLPSATRVFGGFR